MLNRIILIGRLTRDPELKTIGADQSVCNFSLAIDRPFTSANGEKQTDFIDCVAWRKLGEHVAKYMTKGRLVAVEGRLQIRSYDAQDGSKRRVAEVVCDNVKFLDRSSATTGSEGTSSGGSPELPDALQF